MTHGFRKLILISGTSLVVIAASTLAVFCFSTLSVYADPTDWFSPGAITELIEDPLLDTSRIVNHPQQCQMQDILVGNSLTSTEHCVYQAKSFRLAYIEECTKMFSGCNNTSTMAVSIGDDTRFHRINNLYPFWGIASWYVSLVSDRVVLSDGGSVAVIDDMVMALDPVVSLQGMEYSLSTRGTITFGDQTRSIYVAPSANNEWLAGHMEDYGLFRMRLSDGMVRLFADEASSQSISAFSISDDGRFVVTGGVRQDARIYEVDDSCGRVGAIFWTDFPEVGGDWSYANCPNQSLIDMLMDSNGVDHSNAYINSVYYPKFYTTGDSIELLEKLDGNQERWVRLYRPGYDPPEIEYLALGDSYSSGEGDVGRKPDGSSYYLAGTDSRGQCHVSSRSYPFLLADYYGISSSKVASVACSGAKVLPDMITWPAGYMGQDKELAGLDDGQREDKRRSALDSFTPGIVAQIEFVKKYTPKTITLTGGGNDVGFAEVLKYCAGFAFEDFVPTVDSDCGYAEVGSVLEKLLYDSIDTQYTYNKMLIDMVKEFSPDTHIVIAGYPSFINSDMPTCSLNLNSGFLSQNERRVINAATTRMNNMLERLAYDTRVSFVDIENSLYGGRMCEGSGYITGIAAAGYTNVFKGDAQESFHPNHEGHQRIAQAIKQTGALLSDNVPYENDYVKPEDTHLSLPMEIVQGGWFMAGSAIKLTTDSYTFMKDTFVKGMVFSDAIDLGSYKVDSNGRLIASVDTSQLPAGNHVLILEGQTYSGEPVTHYQFVGVFTPAMLEDKEGTLSSEVAVRQEGGVPEALEFAAPNSTDSLGEDVPRDLSFNSEQNEDVSSAALPTRWSDSTVLKADNSGQGWRIFISVAVIVGIIIIGGVVNVIKARRYR